MRGSHLGVFACPQVASVCVHACTKLCNRSWQPTDKKLIAPFPNVIGSFRIDIQCFEVIFLFPNMSHLIHIETVSRACFHWHMRRIKLHGSLTVSFPVLLLNLTSIKIGEIWENRNIGRHQAGHREPMILFVQKREAAAQSTLGETLVHRLVLVK